MSGNTYAILSDTLQWKISRLAATPYHPFVRIEFLPSDNLSIRIRVAFFLLPMDYWQVIGIEGAWEYVRPTQAGRVGCCSLDTPSQQHVLGCALRVH